MLVVVFLIHVAVAPLWPMYNSNPYGTKTSPVAGYYSKGDVPAVRWTQTVELEEANVTSEPVIGGGGVYLAAGKKVMRVSPVGGWTVQQDTACTSLAIPSDSETILALCGGSVVQYCSRTGQRVSQWSISSNAKNEFQPLLIDVLHGLVIITSNNKTQSMLEARSLSGGFLVWQFISTPVTTTPCLTGDGIVLHSTDGKLHLVSPRFGTEIASKQTSIQQPAALMYCALEELIVLSGGEPFALWVFRVTDETLVGVWGETLDVASPAAVMHLAKSTIQVFSADVMITLDLASGKQNKQPVQLKLVGNGMADAHGTVYGADGGCVTLRTPDQIEWRYEPLNCSVAEVLQGTPAYLLSGQAGSVILINKAINFITVMQIGRQGYPSCNTQKKCACAGKLGPRSCAWCDTTQTCIEIGPSKEPIYEKCFSIDLHPCNMTKSRQEIQDTPGTPSSLLGVWRGVQLQSGAPFAEWGFYFTPTEVYLTPPNGTARSYATSYDAQQTLFLTTSSSTVRCTWQSTPNGPQTKQVAMACSGPGGQTPVSPTSALCGRNNATVSFLVACVIPAVQHPACLFPAPTAVHDSFTNMCGDSCQYFSDCPSSCSCQVGTNGQTCCGGGLCPTPQPSPPTPPPTPPVPSSCSNLCTSQEQCSGECNTCIANTCGVPCSGACTSSKHCLGQQCTSCVTGTCQAAGDQCSKTCHDNSDCSSTSGRCLTCVNATCGSPCGGKCIMSSDCKSSSCPFCNSAGQCQEQPAACLGVCMTNADCGNDCKTCFAVSPHPGKCGANCGQNCTASTQCLGSGACSQCSDGTCGAIPPPGDTYICVDAQCKKNNTGYTSAVCTSVCGTAPSGSTPGGIIGRWSGINIAKGYSAREWVATFDTTSVTMYAANSFQWAAKVMTHGPGLFFLFTSPPSLATQNATALFAISQTSSGSLIRSLDIAVGPLGGPLPYDFNGPMVSGFGQYILVNI